MRERPAITTDAALATRGAVRRANRRLMPLLLLMYVLAFLDRTNVGFAQDALRADIGIGDSAYAFGASVFFVGYALLEVPSNLLLVRYGPRRWLARIMVTWGLVAAAMMFVRGEGSFHALRALLGIAEAGFFPGIIYYLTRFYPAADRPRAIGLFYCGAPISFIIGGPVSGALLTLDGVGGLAGWQWMFLVEGLAASLIGVVAWIALADGPGDARWLSAEEQAALTATIARDARATGDGRHASPLAALRSPAVIGLAIIYAGIQMITYGMIFFLPQQVAALLGRRIGLEVGLVSAVPWLFALIATIALPALLRGRPLARPAALTLAGASGGVALAIVASSPALAIAGLCVAAAGVIAVQPLFWSIATARLSPSHAAAGVALINAIGAAGAFAAPNLRVAIDHATGWFGAGLGALAILALGGAAALAWTGRRIEGQLG